MNETTKRNGESKMTIEEKKALAQKINEQTKWDGSDILDILQIALEDANYHTLNQCLNSVRRQQKIETNEKYCINI